MLPLGLMRAQKRENSVVNLASGTRGGKTTSNRTDGTMNHDIQNSAHKKIEHHLVAVSKYTDAQERLSVLVRQDVLLHLYSHTSKTP